MSINPINTNAAFLFVRLADTHTGLRVDDNGIWDGTGVDEHELIDFIQKLRTDSLTDYEKDMMIKEGVTQDQLMAFGNLFVDETIPTDDISITDISNLYSMFSKATEGGVGINQADVLDIVLNDNNHLTLTQEDINIEKESLIPSLETLLQVYEKVAGLDDDPDSYSEMDLYLAHDSLGSLNFTAEEGQAFFFLNRNYNLFDISGDELITDIEINEVAGPDGILTLSDLETRGDIRF